MILQESVRGEELTNGEIPKATLFPVVYPLTSICSVFRSVKTDLDNMVLQKRWLKYLGNMVAEGSILIRLKSLSEFPFGFNKEQDLRVDLAGLIQARLTFT